MNSTLLPAPFEPRLKSIFEEFQSNESWAGKCAYRVYLAAQNGALDAIVPGLIGQDGTQRIIPDLNALNSSSWQRSDVWGINITLCNDYCSRQKFPMVNLTAP